MSAAAVGAPTRLTRIRASRDVRWALGIALFALAIRLVFVLTYGRTDVFDEHATGIAFNDTYFYRTVGETLANGGGFRFVGFPTVHWPPAYPAALAAVFKVFGASSRNALAFNAFLGAATVGLVYLIALRAFGRRAAIGAAALLAIFPGQILMGDVMLAETMYAFELALFVALASVLDRRPRWLILLGVLAGVAALTRGEGLFFPLIVLAMAFRPGARRGALAQTAVVALVMVLVVAPWTIRNYHVAHAFVPVSVNATSTLWAGHNDRANGEAVQILHVGGKPLYGPRGEVRDARILRNSAVKWAVHHPLRELKLIPLKLRSLVRSDSTFIPTWINPHGQRPLDGAAYAIARWSGSIFWYALLLATLGTVVLFFRPIWRDPLRRAILVFMSTAIPLYGFVYYGNPRYRMPLEPLMIVLAAGGAILAWERWGRRASGRVGENAAQPNASTGGR